jgi:hypothetical protein
MKKIFIFLLFSYTVFSQTIIDPQPIIFSDPNHVLDPTTSTKFLKLWNWGNFGKNFDEAMKMNAMHDYPSAIANAAQQMDGYLYLIIPEQNGLIGHWRDNTKFNGMSALYDPTLNLDTTNGNNSSDINNEINFLLMHKEFCF